MVYILINVIVLIILNFKKYCILSVVILSKLERYLSLKIIMLFQYYPLSLATITH